MGDQPPPYGQPPPYDASSPYGQPPPYGASSPYGHPQPFSGYLGPRNEGMAVAALVLAIASFPLTFACGVGFITATVALVLAGQAERKIRGASGALTGEGMVRAARILSWIYLGLTVVVLIIVLLALFVGALGS